MGDADLWRQQRVRLAQRVAALQQQGVCASCYDLDIMTLCVIEYADVNALRLESRFAMMERVAIDMGRCHMRRCAQLGSGYPTAKRHA